MAKAQDTKDDATKTVPDYKAHRQVLISLSRQQYFTLHVPRQFAERADLKALIRVSGTPDYAPLLFLFKKQKHDELRHVMQCMELADYECMKQGKMGCMIFLPSWRFQVAVPASLNCCKCKKAIASMEEAVFFDCCRLVVCKPCSGRHRKNKRELSLCLGLQAKWDKIRQQYPKFLTTHTRSCANFDCKAVEEAAYDETLVLPKSKKCAGCDKVGYCSKECQVADWSARHKHECIRKS